MGYKNSKDQLTYNKHWNKNHKVSVALSKRKSDLKSRYNITLKQYNQMFENQKGCCAICGIHQSKLDKSLGVDHNHITGKIRKLLCCKCNSAVGTYETLGNKIKLYLEI